MSCRALAFVCLIATGLTIHASSAAGASADAPQPGATTQEQTGEEAETLKERLSDKASDDQRVDNCKVAPERRGTKARPEACAGESSKEPPPQPQPSQ